MQSATIVTSSSLFALRATSSGFASGSSRKSNSCNNNSSSSCRQFSFPGKKKISSTALHASNTNNHYQYEPIRRQRQTIRSPSPDKIDVDEEGSVLDLPEEYVRAVPSRRPDIFPDLKEIKQPMPNPLPGDPEMPDEEEEEQERKENPGEPGEDEEEDENGEKITRREKKRREKERENEE